MKLGRKKGKVKDIYKKIIQYIPESLISPQIFSSFICSIKHVHDQGLDAQHVYKNKYCKTLIKKNIYNKF